MHPRTPLLVVSAVSLTLTTLLYIGGMFVVADFLPPPSPALEPDALARLYQQNHTRILAGLTMSFVGTGFMLPLCLVGSVFMAEAERQDGFPFFTVLQSLSALATVLFTALPNFVWMTAAFRADRAPAEIALLHDLGWIMWATPSWGFAFQLLCTGIVGLRDTRPRPLLPRWMSYLALWLAMDMVPTPLVPFFTESGPFAWNGLYTFWIAFCAPIAWIGVLCVLVVHNVRRGTETGPGELAHS